MLRSIKALHGYAVLAKDGGIGKVHDFYFHDDSWTIRYLVVDLGHWLAGRKVLVTTRALGQPDWAAFSFPVALTREQVQKSPETDTDKPVSRQHEVDLHNHFGWPFYWLEPGLGAWPPFVPLAPVPPGDEPPMSARKQPTDPHLRSAREVNGYHIHASDGVLGRVQDFIADDTLWVIRYLVVHTGKGHPARRVLISPQWLAAIDSEAGNVDVTLTREKILSCPEFYPGEPVNREYEERLYDYYGRPTYWEDIRPTAKAGK